MTFTKLVKIYFWLCHRNSKHTIFMSLPPVTTHPFVHMLSLLKVTLYYPEKTCYLNRGLNSVS